MTQWLFALLLYIALSFQQHILIYRGGIPGQNFIIARNCSKKLVSLLIKSYSSHFWNIHRLCVSLKSRVANSLKSYRLQTNKRDCSSLLPKTNTLQKFWKTHVNKNRLSWRAIQASQHANLKNCRMTKIHWLIEKPSQCCIFILYGYIVIRVQRPHI